MAFQIVPITDELIPGFHRVLDTVAREKRYLAFLEAPPLEETTAWVRAGVERGFPHFVALVEDRVVGWCDISAIPRPVHAHCGVLGIGILAEYRRKGIGPALMLATLGKAREIGLTRVELTVRERNTNCDRALRKPRLPPRRPQTQRGARRRSLREYSQHGDAVRRSGLSGRHAVESPFSCPVMEAERINLIASTLSDLAARSAELRRYL